MPRKFHVETFVFVGWLAYCTSLKVCAGWSPQRFSSKCVFLPRVYKMSIEESVYVVLNPLVNSAMDWHPIKKEHKEKNNALSHAIATEAR